MEWEWDIRISLIYSDFNLIFLSFHSGSYNFINFILFLILTKAISKWLV